MGMDLYRVTDGAYFRWSLHYWEAVLDLAMRYGWRPVGTVSPQRAVVEHIIWDGSYAANSGQTVTTEDAEMMAAALEKALPDIPSREAIVDKTANPESYVNTNLSSEPIRATDIKDYFRQLSKIYAVIVGGYFTPDTWDTLNCFEKLAAVKPKLKDFITYLRGGAFEIH